MSYKNKNPILLISFFCLFLIPLTGEAGTSFDTLSFKPANDHGYYLTIEQSQTLGQWGYAIGVTGDLSKNSLVFKNSAGAKIQDVIQKEMALNLGMAMGLSNWLNLGVNISGVPYQQFVTPSTLTQDNGARMGDILLNLKIRLANNATSPVGLALVPFITFPTGNSSHFVGNGKITGGGKLVMDTMKIADRVSFAVNAGTQIRSAVTFSPGATTIGNQFLYGAGMNVEVAKPVQFIAEVNGSTPFNNFFKSHNRDLEIDGALRFLPGEKHRVELTAGGGTGLLKEAGSADWRIFTTLAYRFPGGKTSIPAPAMAPAPEVKEEIITTNKIHFAFNKAIIRSESYRVIEEILAGIQGRPEVENVRIEGHTDSIGSDTYNQKLSEERANAVRTFLINKGYPADKLTATGMGKTTPIADNETKAGRAQNRRVEFHLQIQPGSHLKVEKREESSPTFEEGDSGEKKHRVRKEKTVK